MLLLDQLGARPTAGGWALVLATTVAVLVGTPAAALLGRHLEAPDLPGGGRLLLLACAAVAVLAALDWPRLPPAAWWSTVADVAAARARWLPLLLVVAVPGVAPTLALGPDETLHDARFRRACGYWLAAWAAPVTATVALVTAGSHPMAWLVGLGPMVLLLGALGVRMRLEAFHARGPRLRLALVAITGTALLVAVGTARGL